MIVLAGAIAVILWIKPSHSAPAKESAPIHTSDLPSHKTYPETKDTTIAYEDGYAHGLADMRQRIGFSFDATTPLMPHAGD